MKKYAVALSPMAARTFWGLWGSASDRTVAADIPALSRRCGEVSARPVAQELPFCVLSRDYDEQTGQFALFVGGTREAPGLERLTLPAGLCAQITVRPRFRCLWGAAVGRAKRFFYTRWLPASPYRAANLEYEYHTAASVGRHPAVDLIFALIDPEEGPPLS